RRGLGSAIIELKKNPERYKYRDIVLRCCLKDIAYDVQIEGTKGHYLYTAICALGAKDEFEDILINTFMKRLEHRLFQQLADILFLYADDGSEKTRNALRAKYQCLTEQLSRQRTFPYRYCEREQFEELMIYEVDTRKWAAFKECVADAGRISMMRKDDACDDYDWFLDHCKNIFGNEKIARYFDIASEKSAEVKAFVGAINELEIIREENSRLRVEPEVTLEGYVTRARELEKDEYAYGRMRISAVGFSRQADQNDLKNLVSIIIGEQSDEIKANMLRVFRDIDFPADIDLLINYAESDCERLQDIAIVALERFEDRRVHDLSLKLITSGNLDAGLPLLINNWSRQDEIVIREHVLSSRKVSHATQLNIREIYTKHRSKSCGDILEHVYRYGACAYCRSAIVEAMWRSHVLRTNILDECLYDSYDETRKMAKRIKKS
ncbi:MAG: hypothetical protein LBL26_06590, partial [Peptococcaceae bacterium]|nr:hypothetical protein [Peptococcaceae bacterium]